MASDENLEQVFGRRRRQALHPEIFEDEQIHLGESLHELAPPPLGVGFREILRQVERAPDKRVIAGPNGAHRDRHRGAP